MVSTLIRMKLQKQVAACVKNEEKHTRSLIGPQNDILARIQMRTRRSCVRGREVVLEELSWELKLVPVETRAKSKEQP